MKKDIDDVIDALLEIGQFFAQNNADTDFRIIVTPSQNAVLSNLIEPHLRYHNEGDRIMRLANATFSLPPSE